MCKRNADIKQEFEEMYEHLCEAFGVYKGG